MLRKINGNVLCQNTTIVVYLIVNNDSFCPVKVHEFVLGESFNLENTPKHFITLFDLIKRSSLLLTISRYFHNVSPKKGIKIESPKIGKSTTRTTVIKSSITEVKTHQV